MYLLLLKKQALELKFWNKGLLIEQNQSIISAESVKC